MFKKTRQNRIYENIVEQIQQSIFDGNLKTGDLLPNERELTENFGVGRGTVREAIRVLEHKGLVDIKVGLKGGVRVKEVPSEKVSESLDLLIRTQSLDIQFITEYREGVEPIIVSLAAKRVTESEIAQLQLLKEEAHEAYEAGIDNWQEQYKIGTLLHRKLAEFTRNPIHISVSRSIHNNIDSYYRKLLPPDEVMMEKNHKDFDDLIDAVINHDSKKAKKISEKHIKDFYTYMKKHKL